MTAGPSTAPAIGERQGTTRFQARLTPTLASAVEQTEQAIRLRTGLSLNEIRTIAVWAILGDPDDDKVEAFVRDVLPDWQHARQIATQQQQQ